MGLKLVTDQYLNIPHLTKENKKKLKILQDEVIRNNLNFNLISKSSELNIWNRHIIDSAQLINFFSKRTQKLYRYWIRSRLSRVGDKNFKYQFRGTPC